MTNLPIGSEYSVDAPWNGVPVYCPYCGSDKLEFGPSIYDTDYFCIECGVIFIENEED